jgi:tetratricopeptide (TPR) repeat protein
MRKLTAIIVALSCFAFSAFAQPIKSLTHLADEAFREAYDHHVAKRYDQALDAYSRSIRIRPTNAAVWSNRGLVYQEQADNTPSVALYLKAIADFSEAIKLDPAAWGYRKSRGDSYWALRTIDPKKYPPLAIADLTEYLKARPTDGPAYRRRGECYEEMGQTANAVADLTRAITIDQSDSAAYFRRGTIRWNHGLPGAEEDFEAVLRIEPSDAVARRWLETANAKSASAPAPQPKNSAAATSAAATKETERAAIRTSIVIHTPTKPAASSGPWDVPLAEGKRLIAAGQLDAAMTHLRAEIAKVPASGPNDLVNLFNTRHRTLLLEQVSRVQVARHDYAGAIETMTTSLTALLGAINKDLGTFTEGARSIPDRDTINNFYEMRIPTVMDLLEISGRGTRMFEIVPLPDDLKPRPLVLRFLNIGAGEILASLYQRVAKGHLANAEDCRGKLLKGCGPGSVKDLTLVEANMALEKINKAISIAPAFTTLYATRARIHRYLGNAVEAAADEAQAAKK